MEITIKPADGFNTQIETSQGPVILSPDQTKSLMENAQAQGHKVRVELRAYGYILNDEITKWALKLVGLTSFQATKQTAQGYIEL
jgi:hypothetical protein